MGCCQTLTGVPIGCDTSVGGINRVFIACYDDVSSKTISNGEITAITLKADAEGFKVYNFRPQTSNVDITSPTDQAAGTSYWQSEINLQFSRMETSKRIEIAALSLSGLVVIVEDNNGKYWYFGYDRPVYKTDGGGETGTALADFNGYTIQLTDYGNEPPYEVTKAAMDKIIEAA